jgi:hypothetical protein
MPVQPRRLCLSHLLPFFSMRFSGCLCKGWPFRLARISARVAAFSDYLQTTQVTRPAGLVPWADVAVTRKVAVRQPEDGSLSFRRQFDLDDG